MAIKFDKILGTLREEDSGGSGASSPLTTKGDIWVYGSEDDRLPIGSNGDLLTANSAEALGVEWSTPSSITFGEKVFWGYDTAGGINISSGWTDITLDSEGYKDDEFTHSADSAVVEVDEDGIYQITYYVTTYITSGSSRSDSEARIVIDTGSGYVEEAGSIGGMYNRTAGEDLANASVTIIKSLSATDKIKLQARRNSGSDTVVTWPNSCGLVIRKLIDSEIIASAVRGPQGVPGSDGDITWEGVWSAGTYTPNQAVSHNGSSFVATTTTTEQPSDTASDWDVLASKGDTGGAFAKGIVTSAGSLTASDNLSVNRSATGTYDFTFTSAAQSANYVVLCTFTGSAANVQDWTAVVTSKATTGFTVVTTSEDNGGTADPPLDLNFDVYVSII